MCYVWSVKLFYATLVTTCVGDHWQVGKLPHCVTGHSCQLSLAIHRRSEQQFWVMGPLCDALSPYLWYCSITWCLAEGWVTGDLCHWGTYDSCGLEMTLPLAKEFSVFCRQSRLAYCVCAMLRRIMACTCFGCLTIWWLMLRWLAVLPVTSIIPVIPTASLRSCRSRRTAR